MNAETFTPDNVRQWLEYAPASAPAPQNIDLRGFTMGGHGHFYCTTCCGRLMARGILLPVGSVPLWRYYGHGDVRTIHNGPKACEACGKQA